MTPESGSLELAYPRLCARRALLPTEGTWRRIEPVRELATVLATARRSPLSRWISGIGPTDGAHDIEAALRRQWREEVREVGAWMPADWQPSVRWFATWRDLPVIEHLGRTGEAQPWMDEDPVYRMLVAGEPRGSAGAEQDVPLAELRSLSHGGNIARRWAAAWQARLPHAMPMQSALQAWFRLVIVDRHGEHVAAGGGWPDALRARLELLFRRAMIDPATAFIYLALLAIDLDRLRGELVRRALFGGLPLAA